MVLLLSAITAIFVLRALAGARLVSNSRFTKIREIAHGSHSILKDNKLFMDLLTINLLSIAVMALRFIVAFRAINYKASFILSFTAAQAKTLAIFLNLTPSGIGIAEFSAGVVSRLTDKNLNVGVYAASIDRVVSIVTLLAISLFSAVYFYRYKIRPKGRS
jgi:uncharacterized membrane protein YbhN (UPF0104 family)